MRWLLAALIILSACSDSHPTSLTLRTRRGEVLGPVLLGHPVDNDPKLVADLKCTLDQTPDQRARTFNDVRLEVTIALVTCDSFRRSAIAPAIAEAGGVSVDDVQVLVDKGVAALHDAKVP